jgi:hypothetical protein
MSFVLSDGWRCRFFEENLRTPASRKLKLLDAKNIYDTAERGHYPVTRQDKLSMMPLQPTEVVFGLNSPPSNIRHSGGA